MKYCETVFAAIVLAVAPVVLEAQEVWRLDGRVQWIAGAKMLLIPSAGGSPVNIDLTRVPLDQYAGLRESDVVRVNGLFSTDARRLMAVTIQPFTVAEERVDGQDVTIPLPARR